MRIIILLLSNILLYSFTHAQVQQDQKLFPQQQSSYDLVTNVFGQFDQQNTALPSVIPELKTSFFDYNCKENFWTLNRSGVIQKWSLINGVVTGGSMVLVDTTATGIAFCGEDTASTFYTSNYPTTGIGYYDNSHNLITIPTTIPLSNNGGQNNHQYYMGGINDIIYYFDGNSLTGLDSLTGEIYSVADLAVDKLGQCWVFVGPDITTATNLIVYDSTGIVTNYSININSYNVYGSFFLNDTLYIGVGGVGATPNVIIPILINGNTAQAGTPIPFVCYRCLDMASCYNKMDHSNNPTQASEQGCIFPNPTTGIVYLPQHLEIIKVEVFAINGQLMRETTSNDQLDLGDLSSGVYSIRMKTSEGSITKKLIKL